VAEAIAGPGESLSNAEIGEVLVTGLEQLVAGERVLVLVPDRTRDVPLARLFPVLAAALHRASQVEVMVALGTHPPLPEDDLADLVGLGGLTGPVLSGGLTRPTRISNHAWADPSALSVIGTLSAERLHEIAGPVWHHSLGGDLRVQVNRAALRADRVIVLGPTLPHEVAGFSGGAKYIFPGISGPEMIDVMHWLGALTGAMATIGVEQTPVRQLIDDAAAMLPTPVSLVAIVTANPVREGAARDEAAPADGGIAGVYVGDMREAWLASVSQVRRLHTVWLERPYKRVISCALPIYGELWTAAKAMYKLEAVVADGGELVIYAPHLSVVSSAHGKRLFDVGYHVLPYFLSQWERFRDVPLAVLAHSTHVKGAGAFDEATGRERPRIEVKVASAISAADCERLNLSYVRPGSLDLGRLGYTPLEHDMAGPVPLDLGGPGPAELDLGSAGLLPVDLGAAGDPRGGTALGPYDDGRETLVVPRSGEVLYRISRRVPK
jgi:nickel-dependent lactate racemase